jgi:hypothetical protein
VNKLSAIREALLAELDDPAKLHFVNTRLILTIGVNLNAQLDSKRDSDPMKVNDAIKMLRKMGYLKRGGFRG